MIQIIPYTDTYKSAFKSLNEEWIKKFFTMEKMDRLILENPEDYILGPGGYIAVALLDKKAVGVCALVQSHHDEYDFELSKMGVSPTAQGKGIGTLLVKHIIEQARNMGATKIYLESSTLLPTALHLYKKLGFVKISGLSSPYERSDVQMELVL